MALFRVGFYQPWQDGDQITLSAEAGRLVVFRRSVNMEFFRVCFRLFFSRIGYGSIPIDTIFSGMNIHKSQLF